MDERNIQRMLYDSPQVAGRGRELTKNGNFFFTPSLKAIIAYTNVLSYFDRVSGLNGVAGIHRGQGLNCRALLGVALGGFISIIRSPYSDFTPQSGITKLCWGRGLNGNAPEAFSLSGFFSVLRAFCGDITPQSSTPSVLLNL